MGSASHMHASPHLSAQCWRGSHSCTVLSCARASVLFLALGQKSAQLLSPHIHFSSKASETPLIQALLSTGLTHLESQKLAFQRKTAPKLLIGIKYCLLAFSKYVCSELQAIPSYHGYGQCSVPTCPDYGQFPVLECDIFPPGRNVVS